MTTFRVIKGSIFDEDGAATQSYEHSWELAKQSADWNQAQVEQEGNPDGLLFQAVASDHRQPYNGKAQKGS